MFKDKALCFEGQTVFCGIDVHKKSWKINIRCSEFELEDFTQKPVADGLIAHLLKRYPGADYKIAYEAGFSGFSVQRGLMKSGVNCLVVNPADVPSSDKDKRRKSDKIDARKISRELSNGNLSGIYIPTEEMEHARTLVRQRGKIVRDQTRCKSRILHMMMFSGLKLEGVDDQKYWSRKFVMQLQQLPCGSESLRQALDLAIGEYLSIRQLLSQATKQVRALSKQISFAEIQRLLQSIPGIGPVNAMIIMTEVQDMNRFKTLDKLCSYAGIVPDRSGSGEIETVKGITHRTNNFLRTAIVESSWMIIRKDPAMLMLYKGYCQRMDQNKAIIKIARHLLSRLRYVWLNKKEYEIGIVK